MNEREAHQIFTEEVLPFVQVMHEEDGVPDWPARREAWLDWTDALCKDGQISQSDYDNWDQPACCER